uniref:Uncharacterized protein n=1 Tax=Cannabis sativa TaxID=3483 RepID=A0A803QRU8_CANSA
SKPQFSVPSAVPCLESRVQVGFGSKSEVWVGAQCGSGGIKSNLESWVLVRLQVLQVQFQSSSQVNLGLGSNFEVLRVELGPPLGL